MFSDRIHPESLKQCRGERKSLIYGSKVDAITGKKTTKISKKIANFRFIAT